MTNAVALSGVFGPLILILGIWALLFHKDYYASIEQVKKSSAIMHVGGFINLLLGLFIINVSPHWHSNETFFMTLLGWLLIVRGLVVFFVPSVLHRLWKLSHAWHVFFSFVMIVWGIILCRMAFSWI